MENPPTFIDIESVAKRSFQHDAITKRLQDTHRIAIFAIPNLILTFLARAGNHQTRSFLGSMQHHAYLSLFVLPMWCNVAQLTAGMVEQS